MPLSFHTFDDKESAIDAAAEFGFDESCLNILNHGDHWQWHLRSDPRFLVPLNDDGACAS